VNKTNSVELINLLMQTINEKGVEKTKNILRKGLEDGLENHDIVLGFIIKCICKNYDLSESELFLGRSRKNGVRTNARSMLVYMIKYHLSYSQSQISKMLNLNKALTSRGIKYIGELSENIPHEKKQISKKNKINNEIIIFVENNT